MKLDSLQLDELESKENPLWFHKAGLQQTKTGYGARLTTSRMVRYKNRWYRVYAICFSNTSSLYIMSKGGRIFLE